jgi:hypothetical protein
MPLNRLVALLTPVFALAAGACAAWLAENFPGVDIPPDTLQAIFIAGATAVLAPALHWLHGWQKWETREETAQVVALANDDAHAILGEDVPDEDDDLLDFGLDDAGLDDEEDEAELALAFETGEQPENQHPAGVA